MFKGLFCREHAVGRQRLRVWSVDHYQSIHQLCVSPGYHGSNENIVRVPSFCSNVVALSVLPLLSVATLGASFG